MVKVFSAGLVLMVMLVLTSCSSSKKNIATGDNSNTSLDWSGTYIASKPGVNTIQKSVLTLNTDNKYALETLRDNANFNDKASGSFKWTPSGNTVIFSTVMNNDLYFKVGENQLIELNKDGAKKVDGLVFSKTTNDLVGKKWKLIELNGKAVNSVGLVKEPFLYFNPFDNRVNGNGGCNNMFGEYQLNGLRLSFSKMAMTRMACQNMDIETQLNNVLSNIDNYTVANGILNLNKAKMAPMAKFIAE